MNWRALSCFFWMETGVFDERRFGSAFVADVSLHRTCLYDVGVVVAASNTNLCQVMLHQAETSAISHRSERYGRCGHQDFDQPEGSEDRRKYSGILYCAVGGRGEKVREKIWRDARSSRVFQGLVLLQGVSRRHQGWNADQKMQMQKLWVRFLSLSRNYTSREVLRKCSRTVLLYINFLIFRCQCYVHQ